MTTPKKFIADSGIAIDDFKDFSCSDRTTAVDLAEMKILANKLLGGENLGTGYAIKLCLHGLKIKPDDFIKMSGTEYKLKDMLEVLKKQEGYDGSKTSQGKSSSKKILTPLRIARVYASNVSVLIAKGKVKLPDDLAKIASDVGLPYQFAFLTALYGMSDEQIVESGTTFLEFCKAFDNIIAEAHKKGWADGTMKRSHAEAAKSYIEWRGMALA